MISAIMGRYYWSSKQEADYLHKLTIWWLKRYNYLESGWWKTGGSKWTNSWSGKETLVYFDISLEDELSTNIRLKYTIENKDGIHEKIDYKVPLTSTPCYFGGKKYWFKCPLIVSGNYCGKRVGVLYLYGKYFGCRNCLNLSYSSRNENRRFKDYPLFVSLTAIKTLADLESKIKRKIYRGKPTRKQRVLDRYYQRVFPYFIRARVDK